MSIINLLPINSPALGSVLNGGKLGKVLPDIIIDGILPSSSIFPKQLHDICIVFTVDPFAPDCTISCKLLLGNG